MKFIIYKILIIIVFTLFAFLFNGCGKDENKQQDRIPDVNVSFTIYPNTLHYFSKWMYWDHDGYKGIIIYRLESSSFLAYDRACPYDPFKDCALLEVDETAFFIVDSCCTSRFTIIDGHPFDGPSTIPLKKYNTHYDPVTQRLDVYSFN